MGVLLKTPIVISRRRRDLLLLPLPLIFLSTGVTLRVGLGSFGWVHGTPAKHLIPNPRAKAAKRQKHGADASSLYLSLS